MTESWTPEQYRKHMAKSKKRTKYGSQKVEVDGIKFDSKKEAKRYGELKVRLLAGEISDLELQPVFQIIMEGKNVAKYKADFRYWTGKKWVVEDVKSPSTRLKETYRLKKKLVEAQFQIEIIEP